MLGKFTYENPTKLYFGEGVLDSLPEELRKVGKTILLIYGGGSIKKNGIYDIIIGILHDLEKEVIEISGVMPNPTYEKVEEGLSIARRQKVDFILAVGGGSVIDYAKAIAISIHYDGNPWKDYFVELKDPTCEVVKLGAVLTMVGTGSEMNTGSVITNTKEKLKLGHAFSNPDVFPRFAFLDPTFTYSLPHYQMVAGIFDIFSHICEQYFSGEDDNTSDYLAEGLMRSLLVSSRIANKNPLDYEARSNIMWTATWALNTLISKGKSEDWMVHSLGQSIGALTNATHGMTLACVSLPYYRYILNFGLKKFVRFAENVFGVSPDALSDLEIAKKGLQEMETWMRELGLVLRARDLGMTLEMIPDLVKGTVVMTTGYKTLSEEEIIKIYRESY